MRSLVAFTKKEITEHFRSSKLTVLGLIFLLIGVMNPAVAKLTPWFLEIFADALAESGITVTEVTVTAMDSWVQFFKNIPIALIAFALIESSIFTKEYSTGTLILSLTKGLARYKVVFAKAFTLNALWTLGFWLTVAITYGYNAYFWDNSVAKSLGFSLFAWWLFGLLIIALLTLLSTALSSGSTVLFGLGGVVLVSYIIGLIPKVGKFAPTYLTDGNSLIYGVLEAKSYLPAVVVAIVIIIASYAVSVLAFNKKQL